MCAYFPSPASFATFSTCIRRRPHCLLVRSGAFVFSGWPCPSCGMGNPQAVAQCEVCFTDRRENDELKLVFESLVDLFARWKVLTNLPCT